MPATFIARCIGVGCVAFFSQAGAISSSAQVFGYFADNLDSTVTVMGTAEGGDGSHAFGDFLNSSQLFSDGFESVDTGNCSAHVP